MCCPNKLKIRGQKSPPPNHPVLYWSFMAVQHCLSSTLHLEFYRILFLRFKVLSHLFEEGHNLLCLPNAQLCHWMWQILHRANHWMWLVNPCKNTFQGKPIPLVIDGKKKKRQIQWLQCLALSSRNVHVIHDLCCNCHYNRYRTGNFGNHIYVTFLLSCHL